MNRFTVVALSILLGTTFCVAAWCDPKPLKPKPPTAPVKISRKLSTASPNLYDAHPSSGNLRTTTGGKGLPRKLNNLPPTGAAKAKVTKGLGTLNTTTPSSGKGLKKRKFTAPASSPLPTTDD